MVFLNLNFSYKCHNGIESFLVCYVERGSLLNSNEDNFDDVQSYASCTSLV